jgi:translation initiation factor IF-2
VAGLGLFLLPFVPGRAQQPAEKSAVDKAVDFLAQTQRQQGQSGPTTPAQANVDKVRQVQQDLEKRHKALEEQRQLVELQLKELAAVLQQLNAQSKADPAKPMTGPGPQGIRITAGGPKGPMTGAIGYYQVNPAGGHSASVEQRLEQVEHKLDSLLWEITNMRRDMSKVHTGGGFGGGIMIAPPGMAPGMGGAGGGAKGGPPGGAPGSPGRPGGGGGAGGPMGGGAPPQFSPDPLASAGGALPQAFTPPADSKDPRPTPQPK